MMWHKLLEPNIIMQSVADWQSIGLSWTEFVTSSNNKQNNQKSICSKLEEEMLKLNEQPDPAETKQVIARYWTLVVE